MPKSEDGTVDCKKVEYGHELGCTGFPSFLFLGSERTSYCESYSNFLASTVIPSKPPAMYHVPTWSLWARGFFEGIAIHCPLRVLQF